MGFKLDTGDMERHNVELRMLLDRHRRRYNLAKETDQFERIVLNVLNKNKDEVPAAEESSIQMRFVDPSGLKRLEHFLDYVIKSCQGLNQLEDFQQTLRLALQHSRRQSILVNHQTADQNQTGRALEPFCLFCAKDLNETAAGHEQSLWNLGQPAACSTPRRIIVTHPVESIEINRGSPHTLPLPLPAPAYGHQGAHPETHNNRGTSNGPAQTGTTNLFFNLPIVDLLAQQPPLPTNGLVTPPLSAAPTPDLVSRSPTLRAGEQPAPSADPSQPVGNVYTPRVPHQQQVASPIRVAWMEDGRTDQQQQLSNASLHDKLQSTLQEREQQLQQLQQHRHQLEKSLQQAQRQPTVADRNNLNLQVVPPSPGEDERRMDTEGARADTIVSNLEAFFESGILQEGQGRRSSTPVREAISQPALVIDEEPDLSRISPAGSKDSEASTARASDGSRIEEVSAKLLAGIKKRRTTRAAATPPAASARALPVKPSRTSDQSLSQRPTRQPPVARAAAQDSATQPSATPIVIKKRPKRRQGRANAKQFRQSPY